MYARATSRDFCLSNFHVSLKHYSSFSFLCRHETVTCTITSNRKRAHRLQTTFQKYTALLVKGTKTKQRNHDAKPIKTRYEITLQLAKQKGCNSEQILHTKYQNVLSLTIHRELKGIKEKEQPTEKVKSPKRKEKKKTKKQQ